MKANSSASQLGLAGPGFPFAILGMTMAISLLLWWLASRRASNAARWILAVLAAFGLVSLLLSLGDLPMLHMLSAVLINAVQIAAVWFLFRPDAAAWFKHRGRGMDADVFE